MEKLFAPWLTAYQRKWIGALSFCVVIVSVFLGVMGARFALSYLGSSSKLVPIAGGATIIIVWTTIGRLTGIRIAHAACVGACGAVPFLTIFSLAPIFGGMAVSVSIAASILSVMWVLGHHPRIELRKVDKRS